MSGKPNEAGIEAVRLLLWQMKAARKRLGDYQSQFERAKAEITLAVDEHNDCQQRLLKLLDEMDVAARGNFGWEKRMSYFLEHLVAATDNQP